MKSDFKADIESSGSTKHRQRRQRGAPRGVKATLLKGEDVDGFSRFERVIRTTNDFREIEIVLKVFDLGEYSDLEIRAIVPIQNMVRNRQARHRLRWIGKMREEAIRQRDAALKIQFRWRCRADQNAFWDTIAKRDERKKEKEACIRIQTRYRIVLAKRVLTDRQALAHQRELDRQKRQAEIAIAEEERKKRTQGVVIRIVEAENIKKADRFGKSDPYCKIYWNNVEIGKTQVKHKTVKPLWDDSSSEFVLWPILPDESVIAQEFFQDGGVDESLEDSRDRLTVVVFDLQVSDLVETGLGHSLSKNLKQDPYILLKFGSVSARTSTVENAGSSCNWMNENLKLKIKETTLLRDDLSVEVWNDNNPLPDNIIGKSSIHLGDLHEKGRIAHKDLPGNRNKNLDSESRTVKLLNNRGNADWEKLGDVY